jgi:hypothetical protein
MSRVNWYFVGALAIGAALDGLVVKLVTGAALWVYVAGLSLPPVMLHW